MIGGHGMIVKIDESKFVKSKYKRKLGPRNGGKDSTTKNGDVGGAQQDESNTGARNKNLCSPWFDNTHGHVVEGLHKPGKAWLHPQDFVPQARVRGSRLNTHTQTIEGSWTLLKKAIPV
ncbi:hypothetical protein SEMRO_2719_G335440.1 [Seminavis robusta]|uniref:Transposase n=1 Tax=Seminavis robusta TaxID=568900 RepID=A0A9N8HZ00_9STRA|nr:hypothetical protein SEMRO_2719_G335440.1 [Seminavis robusta]|eukprot:Sro2719_g335440.1 n/a (119) ;mRNA; r:8409-8765